MKRKALIAVLVVAIVSSVNAQVASHRPTIAQSGPVAHLNTPVVRVNGVVLTQSDLLREMYTIFPYANQHNGAFPKAMEPEIRKGAMQMIIFEELVYQEALRRKLTIPAPRLAKAQANFRKQFNSDSEYENVLRQDFHGSKVLLVNKIRRSLLIEALLKSEIDAKSVVTAAEAKAFYDHNPEKFKVPDQFQFQSISILPPESPNPEQQKEAARRADDALRQAKATKSYKEFGLLAEKISEDDYRVDLGDHKAVPSAELPPEIVKVLSSLSPGQVSDLVRLGSAYTIIRLNKHDPARKRTFAEVRVQLSNNLRRQKADRLRTQLDQRLRKGAEVQEL
ncbi:MAG: peptidyl-prolyl cis-trans isomerase [Terriglobia bacterium]|nr:peptidyl-prolyl cis-trans isomerase [Terriglobia bacterium]